MTKIRSPFETLAGGFYLGGFTDKIRLDLLGELSNDYKPYLFHKHGADTQFMNFFGLCKEDMIEGVKASNDDDAQMAKWFEAKTNLTDEKREAWNAFSVNLG